MGKNSDKISLYIVKIGNKNQYLVIINISDHNI